MHPGSERRAETLRSALRCCHLAAILAVAAACASMEGPAVSDNQLMGTYENSLPAASGGGERTVGVMLMANRAAAITSAFSGQPNRFFVQGKWDRIGNQVILSIAGPRPERLVFEYVDGQLVAKDWDPRTWGSDGPGTLKKQ